MGMSEADWDMEATQRSVARMEKVRKAVNARRYTDKPGGLWHLDDMDHAFYVGTFGKARIWSADDGNSYDVRVYSFTGAEVAQGAWKGLDSAFRNGEKLANAER